MAEELGAGYISLLPSMRGFSAAVKKELKTALAGVRGQGVEIPVTPKFDQKMLDESLKANKKPLRVPVQLEPLRDKVHGNAGTVKVGVEIDRNAFQRSLTGLGRDSRSTIHQKVEVDTDKDFIRREVAESARSAGSAAAGIFSNGFGASLPMLLAGVVATAMGAPLIAVATGALILAGAALGAVFIGAFLLAGDKDLQAGVQKLFGDVKTQLTEAAQPLKGPFLEAIGIIGQAFKDIGPDVKTFFSDIAKSGGIQDLARGVKGFIKSFSETGALKKLGQAIGPVLSQIGMILPDIGNAISQLIITITKPQFIQMVGKIGRAIADVIRFIGDVIGWLAGFANAVVGTFKDIWSGLKIVFNAIVGAITGNMDKVRPLKDLIVGIFTDIGKKIGLVPEKIDGLVTTVRGIPNRIQTALGDLGNLLRRSGESVVQGLIDGIKSRLGPLGTIMSTVAGTVYNYLQHSPAKYGPLSGRGNTFYSGQEMATALASGMDSKLPTVATAAGQLAGAAAPGWSTSAAGPSSAPTEAVAGDRVMQMLLDLIRESIRRDNGGDVVLRLGSKSTRFA